MKSGTGVEPGKGSCDTAQQPGLLCSDSLTLLWSELHVLTQASVSLQPSGDWHRDIWDVSQFPEGRKNRAFRKGKGKGSKGDFTTHGLVLGWAVLG